MLYQSLIIVLSICSVDKASGFFGLWSTKPKLSTYNVDNSSVTTSGISSGGAMTMQFHFIHSNIVNGVGIFAGVPYLCADNALAAPQCLTSPELISENNLVEKAEKWGVLGYIDSTDNLKSDNVYIFHGKVDTVVLPTAGKKIKAMYEDFGANVKAEFGINAAHGWPTEDNGGVCYLTNPFTDFILDCDYAGSFEMLNHLYNNSLTKPSEKVWKQENIIDFDQKEFGSGFLSNIADDGFLYVPTACKDKSTPCKLHIAFHGCMSNQAIAGYKFATETGFANVAEANNIIVLFPQMRLGINPQGCWDFFGYTGQDFAKKTGVQVKNVFNMMNRIISG